MMDEQVKAALEDLLTVTSLGEITPVRIQRWQAAVRTILTPVAIVIDLNSGESGASKLKG